MSSQVPLALQTWVQVGNTWAKQTARHVHAGTVRLPEDQLPLDRSRLAYSADASGVVRRHDLVLALLVIHVVVPHAAVLDVGRLLHSQILRDRVDDVEPPPARRVVDAGPLGDLRAGVLTARLDLVALDVEAVDRGLQVVDVDRLTYTDQHRHMNHPRRYVAAGGGQ